MALLREEITIDGINYDCRELSMSEMMPLLEEGGVGISLIRTAVFVDDVPLGDQVDAMGFRTGKKLVEIVNRINGLAGDGDETAEELEARIATAQTKLDELNNAKGKP